ncbi:MAG: hypothetical protein FWF46_07475 [Oscillospiraceae bacterium]|nr:hypothetical protein [Oscillospiraceae bacterium]
MDNLTLENNLNESKQLENNQNSFLKTTFGMAVNEALNFGLRSILPDFIENQVIEIKDSILNNGLKAGLDTAIEKAIDLGKSAIGIFTGNFEKISQIETAVQKGGLIESATSLINTGIKAAEKNNLINSNVAKTIEKGIDIIGNSLDKNIGNSLKDQKDLLDKINTSIDNWNQYREKGDFTKMDLEYNKIKENLNKLVPLEETLQRVAEVENINNLIKNNGNNFNLTEEQLALAKKLA